MKVPTQEALKHFLLLLLLPKPWDHLEHKEPSTDTKATAKFSSVHVPISRIWGRVLLKTPNQTSERNLKGARPAPGVRGTARVQESEAQQARRHRLGREDQAPSTDQWHSRRKDVAAWWDTGWVAEPVSVPCRPLQPSMNHAVARNLERPASLQPSSLLSTAHGSPFLIGLGVRVDATKNESPRCTCARLWVSISSTDIGLG